MGALRALLVILALAIVAIVLLESLPAIRGLNSVIDQSVSK